MNQSVVMLDGDENGRLEPFRCHTYETVSKGMAGHIKTSCTIRLAGWSCYDHWQEMWTDCQEV